MTKKKNPLDWMDEKVQNLKKLNEILIPASEIYGRGHYWSALKIICLVYILDIYSTIMNKKRKIFENFIFINIFAGCGINQIRDKGNRFLFMGSPFTPLLLKKNIFKKIILFESDENYITGLTDRKNLLIQNNMTDQDYVEIKNLFSDNSVDEITEIITSPKTHAFIFIDPEGITEINFNQLSKLLELRIDLLFLFVDMGVFRNRHNNATVTTFWGDNSWNEVRNSEDYIKKFFDKLIKLFPEKSGEYIKIKGPRDQPFFYNLIYLTKKDAEWLQGIRENLKKRIESNSGDYCKYSFEYLSRSSRRLTDFI